jgi:hypothetical protein
MVEVRPEGVSEVSLLSSRSSTFVSIVFQVGAGSFMRDSAVVTFVGSRSRVVVPIIDGASESAWLPDPDTYRVEASNLPPGYVVRSITSSATSDLTNGGSFEVPVKATFDPPQVNVLITLSK